MQAMAPVMMAMHARCCTMVCGKGTCLVIRRAGSGLLTPKPRATQRRSRT